MGSRSRTFTAALGALVLLVPACGDSASTTEAPLETTSTIASPDPGEATTTTVPAGGPDIAIEVADGEPVGGVNRYEVARGETVTIAVISDVADELHIHGYDLHADVEAGGTATVTFDADIPGVFEIELEDSKILIGQLAVS